MSYCDTCCHQYSDICGGCETLEGVPVKYTEKEREVAMTARQELENLLVELKEKGQLIPETLKLAYLTSIATNLARLVDHFMIIEENDN